MICPNCQKDQKVGEQNYGALYTCPSCQAVYFINFDGAPEFGDVSTESFESVNSEMLELNVASEGMGSFDPTTASSAAAMEDLPELGSIEPLVPSNNLLDPISNDPLGTPQYDFNQQGAGNLIDNPFDLQNNMAGINSDVIEEQTRTASIVEAPKLQTKEVPKPQSTTKPQTQAKQQPGVKQQSAMGAFADIAQELSDFGNTDSHLSGLSYDLIVSGIDTQETKSLFKEAIEDSKFAWDSFEIMKSIKNGRVEIKKLTPVKAYLLAKRIQFLDIEKIWKQNVSV